MIVRFEDASRAIQRSANKVLKKHAVYLKEDLKAAWPVKTGASKAGWRVQNRGAGYAVTNNVKSPSGFDYVTKLWHGSSSQMPLGGDPIVQRRRIIVLRALRKMNFSL